MLGWNMVSVLYSFGREVMLKDGYTGSTQGGCQLSWNYISQIPFPAEFQASVD